jgi:hypothetical protein
MIDQGPKGLLQAVHSLTAGLFVLAVKAAATSIKQIAAIYANEMEY